MILPGCDIGEGQDSLPSKDHRGILPHSRHRPVAVTDGRIVSFAVAPYRQDEVDLIRKLTGERVPATVGMRR
jgi:hypothetical protein